MPKKKIENKIDHLADAINEIQKSNPVIGEEKDDFGIVDIETFCTSPNYLNLPGNNFFLYDSQRVILKSFYMGSRGNENLRLSQKDWEWLYANEEDEVHEDMVFEKNIKDVIKKIRKKEQTPFTFRELHLVMGRRGTKCREENDIISTTEGSITFRELCDRLNYGEKIGICTYDPKTFKRSITYDIKAEDNGIDKCFSIETKRGIKETSSWNHPYLVWREDWSSPMFVQMSELLPGDKVAVAKSTELFGKTTIGVNRAALLGHLQGDGGTAYSVKYTTASETMLSDIRRIISQEFPGYVVKHNSKYDYDIVKKSGMFKQNGSQSNNVKEWLICQDCFGKKSIDKEVPESILRGSKEEVVAFLSRLYGCDGYAHASKVNGKTRDTPHIGYCSSSRKLIDGVRHLLQKFGIHAHVCTSHTKCNGKTFRCWRLIINRKNCIKIFEKEINIFSKEHAVRNVGQQAESKNKPNSIFDGVPIGIWNHIKNIKTIRGLSDCDILGTHGVGHNHRLRRQYSPCQEKVLSYGESIQDEFLLNMGSADIKWDEIASITSVGDRSTIAMEVVGTNIIGGDIISHNTVVASVITAYEVYKLLRVGNGNPHNFYGLPDDDPIAIINVALSQDQAGVLFEQIQNRFRNAPVFKGRIAKGTTQEIRIYTDCDLKKMQDGSNLDVTGSIVVRCGHSNPDTLRGRSTILILFDELAFYDESGKVTGKHFYDTLKPSLSKFYKYGDGRLVEISSPSAASGIFYDIFERSKKYDSILSFQLPTWCSNPDITYDDDELKQYRESNPDAFASEYGAQWSKSGTYGQYFPEGLIERCIRTDIEPHMSPKRGFNYYLHVDPALSGDRYVAVLVAKEYYVNNRGKRRVRVHLARTWIWTPQPGVGLLFNEIDKEIINICSRYHPLTVTYDQWNSVASLQLLRSHGINCVSTSFNRSYKNKIYQSLKDMMGYQPEPEIWLYDECHLLSEMKALRFRPTSRGVSLVVDRHGPVKTDDLVDCLAGATASASEAVRMALPLPRVVKTGWQ